MHAAHTPLYKCRPCSFLVQTTYKVDPTVPHEPKLVDHIISLLQLLESICTVSWPEMFFITCMHVKFSEFSPYGTGGLHFLLHSIAPERIFFFRFKHK